jgi:hypothetical protein
MGSAMMAARAWLTSDRSTGLENLMIFWNGHARPATHTQGRVYTNHLKPDTHHDFAGALTSSPRGIGHIVAAALHLTHFEYRYLPASR